jgi:2'-deoxynucleoside 5'-phosphate N-hydrolase
MVAESMKAYISICMDKWPALDGELHAISKILSEYGIEPHIYVDRCRLNVTGEKEMMMQVMKEIEESYIILLEVSGKAVGIDLEAGYAKGKGRPLVYLRNSNADHSRTVAGISDFQVIYKDPIDLSVQLEEILKSIR